MKHVVLALALAVPFSAFAATKKKAPKAEPKEQTFKVDTKSSVAKWEGRKLGGAHHGVLKFKDGTLAVNDGQLAGGDLTIDMTTLKDEDLTDPEWNNKLVTHLKSPDFFNIAQFPTSSLKITKVEKQGDKATITGDLTIKGVTQPVTFPADVKLEKGKLTAKGDMTVDRTKYDIKFRSLRFFPEIGDKVIKDDFTVSVELSATK